MDQSKIPPEHAAQMLAFLQERSTVEVVDLIELATAVFVHGQTVYNFHIPGNRTQTQTFYIQDVPAMFEELRKRLPVDDVQMLRTGVVVETPSVQELLQSHPKQVKFAHSIYSTVVIGDKEH